MTEIVRYEVGSGTVLVEVADNSFGVERPARNEQGITDAGRRLEDALSAIRPAANAAAEVLKEVGAERLELQFGVKLAGEAGAIIAQNCSEGHFIVTMSFTHGARRAPGAGGRNHAVSRLQRRLLRAPWAPRPPRNGEPTPSRKPKSYQFPARAEL